MTPSSAATVRTACSATKGAITSRAVLTTTYAEGGDDGDQLFGDDGDDTLLGGAGWDFINGGFGNDVIDGGATNDELWGLPGDDIIRGGEGPDRLFGNEGADQLSGDAPFSPRQRGRRCGVTICWSAATATTCCRATPR